MIFFLETQTHYLCTCLSICETCLRSQKRRLIGIQDFHLDQYKEMTAHISKNWVSYSHCAGQILYSSFSHSSKDWTPQKYFAQFLENFYLSFRKMYLSNQSWTLCAFKSRITCLEIFLLCIILSYLQGGRNGCSRCSSGYTIFQLLFHKLIGTFSRHFRPTSYTNLKSLTSSLIIILSYLVGFMQSSFVRKGRFPY